MKKLNILVAAISLGLTARFAILPVASAHSTHSIGNTHTKHAHHKYTLPKKRLKQQHANQPDFSKLFEACERVTAVDVTSGVTTLPASAIGTGATPFTVASFTVPRYCDNSIALTVNATIVGTSNVQNGNITCQIFDENGTPIGSPSSAGNYAPLNVAIPVIAAEKAKTFPTFLPGRYGYYGSGASFPGYSSFLQMETKTVRCTAAGVIIIGETSPADAFTINSIAGQVDSQAPSPDLAPVYEYELDNSYTNGYDARSTKHSINY